MANLGYTSYIVFHFHVPYLKIYILHSKRVHLQPLMPVLSSDVILT